MITPTPTTELEAVNAMLFGIGESPVNSLDGTKNVDVATAQATLARVSKEVQAEGWAFNSEYEYTLTPDQSGYIQVPANTIRVDADKETSFDIVLRGTKLYDRKGKTNTFTKSLKVELVVFLPYDELPECARQYIYVRAAREFQDGSVGSEALHKFKQSDEARARVRLEREESETGDHSIFDSYLIASIVNRGAQRRYH